MEVDKEMLGQYFYTRAIIYDDSFKLFYNSSGNKIQTWLDNLSKLIYDNDKTHTLSMTVKDKLYKILSIFREKTDDFNILNQINELISLLNKSSEENYVQMITDEFANRVLNITPLNKIIEMKFRSWDLKEQMVTISFMEDSIFFIELTKTSESKFLKENIGSEIALPSISNLLVNHSEILKEPLIMDRIVKLLNYNIASPRPENSVFGNLQDSSKICLKKIKKIK